LSLGDVLRLQAGSVQPEGNIKTGWGNAKSVIMLFLSQVVYLNIAATIPTGAMAERWTFKSFVVYGFFIAMFVYPLYAHWMWGGGWLAQLGRSFGLGHGVLDFAGSSVVHMVGGVAGLAGAIVLGLRVGKYRANGTPLPFPDTISLWRLSEVWSFSSGGSGSTRDRLQRTAVCGSALSS
jgi:ammonia channel protein AmtB